MVEATMHFMDGHLAKWQSIVKIGEVRNNLGAVYQAIEVAGMEQLQSKVNTGKIKLDLKRTICEKADIMNDIIEVYAQMTGDKKLAQKMSSNASDLFRLKYDDTMRQVKVIIEAAVENQEVLTAEYGLNAEQISGLQADYDRFMEMNGQPREYQIKSAVATLTLEELFAEANNLLVNHLDNLLKIFKRRDPSFYNGYLKARMVVNY